MVAKVTCRKAISSNHPETGKACKYINLKMQTDFQHVATSFVRLQQRMQHICESSLWNWRLNSAVCSILVLFVCKSKVPKCLCHYAVQSPCCCVTKGGGISEFCLRSIRFCLIWNFAIFVDLSKLFIKVIHCIITNWCDAFANLTAFNCKLIAIYIYFDTFDRVTHKGIYNLFIHVRKKSIL